MSRISSPSFVDSFKAPKPLLAAVQEQLGVAPELTKPTGRDSAALKGLLSLNGVPAKAQLEVKLHRRVTDAYAATPRDIGLPRVSTKPAGCQNRTGEKAM